MRKQAQALQIDRSSVGRIINRELKFHPIRMENSYKVGNCSTVANETSRTITAPKFDVQF